MGHVTPIILCELMNARKNLIGKPERKRSLESNMYAYLEGGDNIKLALKKLYRCAVLIQLVGDADFVNMSMQLGFHKSWEYMTNEYFSHSSSRCVYLIHKKKTPWLQSASEPYRQRGCRRSAKLVPTFADRVVSRGQPNGSPRPFNLCFLDRSRYFLFK